MARSAQPVANPDGTPISGGAVSPGDAPIPLKGMLIFVESNGNVYAASSGTGLHPIDMQDAANNPDTDGEYVVGPDAEGTAPTHPPVLTGGVVSTGVGTALTDGQVGSIQVTKTRKVVTHPWANPDNLIQVPTQVITDNAAHDLIAAQGASTKIYFWVNIQNSHPTVGTLVTVTEETSGVVLFECYAAPLGGGNKHDAPTPIPVATNKKVIVTCTTTGANVLVNATAYKAAA